jgi:hypothetical protein
MRHEILVYLTADQVWSHHTSCAHTCIIVMMDCLALDNSVSPQAPISFLSCIILCDWVRADKGKMKGKKTYSRRYEPIYGHGVHSSVGIYREQVLIKSWVDTNGVLDLMVHL